MGSAWSNPQDEEHAERMHTFVAKIAEINDRIAEAGVNAAGPLEAEQVMADLLELFNEMQAPSVSALQQIKAKIVDATDANRSARFDTLTETYKDLQFDLLKLTPYLKTHYMNHRRGIHLTLAAKQLLQSCPDSNLQRASEMLQRAHAIFSTGEAPEPERMHSLSERFSTLQRELAEEIGILKNLEQASRWKKYLWIGVTVVVALLFVGGAALTFFCGNVAAAAASASAAKAAAAKTAAAEAAIAMKKCQAAKAALHATQADPNSFSLLLHILSWDVAIATQQVNATAAAAQHASTAASLAGEAAAAAAAKASVAFFAAKASGVATLAVGAGATWACAQNRNIMTRLSAAYEVEAKTQMGAKYYQVLRDTCGPCAALCRIAACELETAAVHQTDLHERTEFIEMLNQPSFMKAVDEYEKVLTKLIELTAKLQTSVTKNIEALGRSPDVRQAVTPEFSQAQADDGNDSRISANEFGDWHVVQNQQEGDN